jgi:FkbM family methyltransferase
MAMISYAQNREDVLLNRVFPDCPEGSYIDVGACHPVVDSVTKLFYERGWRGINIEPLPSLCDMLARDRRRDINLRVGLSNREGASTLYECPAAVESSTLSEERAEEMRRQGFELVEHSIPVTTLARVCEQHAGPAIDFLKIDVESHEREVLEGADWGRYRPRVVLVEATWPATNIPSYEHWEPLLLEADYLFAFFDGLNRYYVRAEERQLLPLLAVPVNVFDQYEIYEYQQQIQELRHTSEASRQSLETTLAARDIAQTRLDEAQNALAEMRRALEATQAQLAPFQELGPIAIGVARRLRRMSRQSPRLASIAKRMIPHAHPGV